MPVKTTVIIPVHNSLEYTKQALYYLFGAISKVQDGNWEFPVALVDDGSEDGTSDWVKKQYPEIHLCHGDGNLWWSGSINLGMRYAIETLQADYLLWWNNDIRPAEDYFTNLVELLRTTDGNIVFGSKILYASKPDVIWSFGGVFHPVWGHSHMPGMNQPDGQDFQHPESVDWLPGMGTVLPVSIASETGWLNERQFPQYHGDVDYTYRVKLSGFRVEVRPELRIWNDTEHSGMKTGGKFPERLASLRKLNSIHNFRKEWLLYRKYAKTPLAYLMVAKRYLVYVLRLVVGRV